MGSEIWNPLSYHNLATDHPYIDLKCESHEHPQQSFDALVHTLLRFTGTEFFMNQRKYFISNGRLIMV